MENALKLQALRRQIAEANGGQPEDFEGWRRRTDATLRTVMGRGHESVRQFADVRYSPMAIFGAEPDGYFARVQADGVRDAIAVMEGAIYELELSSPTAPPLGMDGLHPWVTEAAAKLWEGAHYRAAVSEAGRVIDGRLKAKVGSTASGYKLVTEAFSTAPPTAKQRRLRFDIDEGTELWTDMHQGAMSFGQGCVMRIRNVLVHGGDEPTRQEAAEYLAALSLLARWIDAARVVSA